MRCPKLEEIPCIKSVKKGWPWKQETPQLPKTFSNGSSWPKISIITPSLNQGHFLEETIRSVLLQGYPNIEYIIIDGGSTDESVDIIKKYEKWLTYWISEPDEGQSHALNKGFKIASGDIFAYINSDDLYEPDAFINIASIFVNNHPYKLVAGECTIFCEENEKRIFKPWWPENPDYYLRKTYSSTFAQPTSFWKKDIYQKLGGFDETLNYCFDKEFFLRMALIGITPYFIFKKIARFREHPQSKTVKQAIHFHQESIRILNKHANACDIAKGEKKRILREIKKEIQYAQVFISWKTRGRLTAIQRFFSMLLRSPYLILERKIVGQMRRLFFFRARNVEELNLN